MALRNRPLKMGLKKIEGLLPGTEDEDAVNLKQLNDAIAAIDLSPYATLDSPTFTGDPKAPTPDPGDNDTSIATTAFVQSELADYAPLDSPALTGTPTAPTPSPGDNSTKIATTAYVDAATSWHVVGKTADQAIASSAALADDTHLQFAMAANTTYHIKACYVASVGSGGVKISCNGPAMPALVGVAGIIANATTTSQNIPGARSLDYEIAMWDHAPVNANMVYHIQGVVQNGPNAGTFALRIAQNSSDVSPTSFLKGSWLEYRALS